MIEIQDYNPRLKRSIARMSVFEWAPTKDWYFVHGPELEGQNPGALAVTEYLNENNRLNNEDRMNHFVFMQNEVRNVQELRKKIKNYEIAKKEKRLDDKGLKKLEEMHASIQDEHAIVGRKSPFRSLMKMISDKSLYVDYLYEDFEFTDYAIFVIDNKPVMAFNDDVEKAIKDGKKLLIRSTKEEIDFMNKKMGEAWS